jgi:hypothetical protein
MEMKPDQAPAHPVVLQTRDAWRAGIQRRLDERKMSPEEEAHHLAWMLPRQAVDRQTKK